MSTIKKFPLTIGAIIMILACCFCILTGCESDEMKTAKAEMNTEIERIEGQIKELQAAIDDAQTVAETEETPLDEAVIPALENQIADAKTIEFAAPSTPSSVEEVIAETDKLKEIDYTDDIQGLIDAENAVTNSIEQNKLVTNPSEAFVIERLQGVEGVGEIAALTEETDTNGLLGKAGSYVAKVNFISPLVDQSQVYGGSTIAEKGCDGGGTIEVFSNVEDAKKRESYLASFDGGILASGSHKVVGTVLVRTSDKLTASQQAQLEAAIIESLTRLH